MAGTVSVDLDNAVDFPHKEQTRQEPNGARHDKEQQHNDGRIAKEEEVAEGPRDAGLVDKVVQREEEEVEGCGARGEE